MKNGTKKLNGNLRVFTAGPGTLAISSRAGGYMAADLSGLAALDMHIALQAMLDGDSMAAWLVNGDVDPADVEGQEELDFRDVEILSFSARERVLSSASAWAIVLREGGGHAMGLAGTEDGAWADARAWSPDVEDWSDSHALRISPESALRVAAGEVDAWSPLGAEDDCFLDAIWSSGFDGSEELGELPEAELETGGIVTYIARMAGYDESGRTVANNLGAWGWSLRRFAAYLRDAADEDEDEDEDESGRDVSGIDFVVPPICQGQAVEVAYGLDDAPLRRDCIIRRTYDRSTGGCRYERFEDAEWEAESDGNLEFHARPPRLGAKTDEWEA